MKKLPDVSDELAPRILSKVGFKKRFIGGKLRHRRGIIRVTSYSFKEVVNLLNDEMPMIHFSALETWIREVMRDKELAEKMAEAIHKQKNYLDTLSSIKVLMEERLTQCQKQNILAGNF